MRAGRCNRPTRFRPPTSTSWPSLSTTSRTETTGRRRTPNFTARNRSRCARATDACPTGGRPSPPSPPRHCRRAACAWCHHRGNCSMSSTWRPRRRPPRSSFTCWRRSESRTATGGSRSRRASTARTSAPSRNRIASSSDAWPAPAPCTTGPGPPSAATFPRCSTCAASLPTTCYRRSAGRVDVDWL